MPKHTGLSGAHFVARAKSFLVFICLLSVYAPGNAQTNASVRTTGRFLTDTIKVGMPVRYALSSRHPAATQVIFPDTAFSFRPFEWISKRYFPTRTDSSGLSIDSAVYTLVSFQLEDYQRLALPVYVVQKQDCTAVFAAPDSVFLKRLLTPQDVLPRLRTNTELASVPQQTNYPLFAGVVTGVTLVVLILYFFFGKRITKRYKLFRMGRHHRGFVSNYEKLVRRIRQQVDVDTVANAVVIWKEYMEWLEERPFSTYTTKEIIEILPDQGLAEALQETDRVIYAQMPSENSFRSVRTLEYIALRRYREKRALLESRKAREVV
jgi:hypothetical protein